MPVSCFKVKIGRLRGFYRAHILGNNPSHTCANAMLPMSKVGTFCSSIYFSLTTHVFTASSTALDRSPFLPPNLSMVLNLSFFSNSSESATLIRPISITIHNQFLLHRFFARGRARCFSSKQIGSWQGFLLCSLSFSIHLKFAYSYNVLYTY